jgi:hypothetical protein
MKGTTQQPTMTTATHITTRQARHRLFTINTPEADSLRQELFNIEDQDGPLPTEFVNRFNKAIA